MLETLLAFRKVLCDKWSQFAVFLLEDVWLCVSSIKTGTRRIMRLDELSSVVRFE